jgi:type VI secretion system secreted protein VgrG
MADPSTIPTLTIDGTDAESWGILGLRVRETLSDGYRLSVRAVAEQPPELDDLIGKDASCVLRTPAGERTFRGVVLEIADEHRADTRVWVEVVIGSRIELLKLGRDHRWFQEKSVPDIVKEVLDGAGLSGMHEWSITATYEPRDYVAQYAESDFQFVTRLLGEEGIGFLVRDLADATSYVFFDDDKSFEPMEGDSVLRERTSGPNDESTFALRSDRLRASSDEVRQRDYDLEHPATNLDTEKLADGSAAREIYVHPGDYVDTGRGQRLTDRWLERVRMLRRTMRGESDCVRLAPGRIFTLERARREASNGDYLVLEVEHACEPVGENPDEIVPSLAYACSVSAIPIDVPYRPARVEAPVLGVQPAFVTVPGGEEIHSDSFGRVKVRYPWDRSGITDDQSSFWLRVGQVALGGSMILPRIDFEVLVDFELGDLDRPAVSGHLYHAELPPPYALPGGRTRSSFQTATTGGGAGSNELRFEDAAGAEEIYINASKDLNASIDDNMDFKVAANETVVIGANNSLGVKAPHKTVVTGNRTMVVSGNQNVDVGADYSDGTGANLSVTVSGSRMVKSGGDHNETIGGTLTRSVDGMHVIIGLAGINRTVVGSSTVKVNAIWAEVAGAARGLTITGSYSETISAAKLIKAKGMTVNCGAAFTMNAAAHVVKAGGGRSDTAKGALALTGSAFKVKAKSIVFEAESKLVFRGGGGVIELTKAGMVKIKAPSITVENSKALNQIMHKSN